MQPIQIPQFDPTWRDDVFDQQALEIPLALPQPTPRNQSVWIAVRPVREEVVFGKHHRHETFRRVTTVLKPSEMAQYYEVRNSKKEVIPHDDPVVSLMFPPKAWMSDAGEERCTMFAAAKLAQGHVLVGGLGLGIYPQFAFALQRPIESLTIVERDPQIIRFVREAWLQHAPESQAQRVTIIEGSIETYLSQTDRLFDTIYFDTWDDADPRFLAHVNHLLSYAAPRCTPTGTIRCWGYALMLDTFIKTMQLLTKEEYPFHKHHLDPVLEAYVAWLNQQPSLPNEADIEQAARHAALSVQQSIDTYDRHRCFTAFGVSLADAHRNMAMSRKEL